MSSLLCGWSLDFVVCLCLSDSQVSFKWPNDQKKKKKKKKDYLELLSYFIALFVFVVLCLAVQHFEVTFFILHI